MYEYICDGTGNVLYKWEQLWDPRPRILVFCPWCSGLASRMLPRGWVVTAFAKDVYRSTLEQTFSCIQHLSSPTMSPSYLGRKWAAKSTSNIIANPRQIPPLPTLGLCQGPGADVHLLGSQASQTTKTTAYDRNFEQNLVSTYPPFYACILMAELQPQESGQPPEWIVDPMMDDSQGNFKTDAWNVFTKNMRMPPPAHRTVSC